MYLLCCLLGLRSAQAVRTPARRGRARGGAGESRSVGPACAVARGRAARCAKIFFGGVRAWRACVGARKKIGGVRGHYIFKAEVGKLSAIAKNILRS